MRPRLGPVGRRHRGASSRPGLMRHGASAQTTIGTMRVEQKGMNLGVILAIVGIVAAIIVPLSIEVLKRPRLEIVPTPWSPGGPVEWTFAVVQVLNKPLTGPLARLLSRQAAQGCVVDIDYFSWGLDEKLMPTVHGRWSSHPEPLRSVPARRQKPRWRAGYTPGAQGLLISPAAPAPPTREAPRALIPAAVLQSHMQRAQQTPRALTLAAAPEFPMRGHREHLSQRQLCSSICRALWSSLMKPPPSSVYDPTFDPRQQDVAVSWDGKGEEVAVAILTQSGAFAFSTASYEHFRFSNPDWQLSQGTYRISVHVRGSNVDLKQDFKLEYLDKVFANFRLQPIWG